MKLLLVLLLLASSLHAETITAYCCCDICCGPRKDLLPSKKGHSSKRLAANGKPPVEGVTCAGPRRLPLGTVVWIEGVGRRVVTDRTARRYDGRFDVYFNSHRDAKRFGIRQAKVKI